MKIKGKYYITQVVEGKIREKIKWSPRPSITSGKINKRIAIANYKEGGSIVDDKKRVLLVNMYEVTDYTLKVKKGKDRQDWRGQKKITGKKIPNDVGQYQYVITGTIKRYDKHTQIHARSEQHDKGYPLDKARGEAFERFLMKLNGVYVGKDTGDADDGWDRFSDVSHFKEGIVYYEGRG